MSLPDALALTVIANGSLLDSAPVRNNYAAIQTGFNALVAELGPIDNPPCCRVYNSSNISISNGTDTALTFDSERFDTDTIHSTSADTSRLTATTAGVYQISGMVSFASNSTGRRMLNVRLNGSTVIAAEYEGSPPAGDPMNMAVSTLYKLAAGDYVELVVNQTSGGALNALAAGNYSPEFGMVRVAVG